MYTPVNPMLFYYKKRGLMVSKLYRRVFVMGTHLKRKRQWGDSNEYPQQMLRFLWGNKKIYQHFSVENRPYLELCYDRKHFEKQCPGETAEVLN